MEIMFAEPAKHKKQTVMLKAEFVLNIYARNSLVSI